MQPALHASHDPFRVRTRAMLRLFFVAGGFLVFLLLGCTLLSPPAPMTFVFVGDPQPALLPGASRTFTVTVLDNLNHQPAAYSHIDIALVHYLATGKNSYQKLSSVQTSRTGQFTFTLTLPPIVAQGDQFQIHFHAPDEASGQDIYQPITLINEIAVTFPAWPDQAARGTVVQLTAQVSDTQQQRPVSGALITLTQRFYHQESGWEELYAPVATTRTDARGQIQLPYTIPLELKAGDQIEVAFQVQSDEHTLAHSQSLLVQPNATIELLGAPYTLVTGIAASDQQIDNVLATAHQVLTSVRFERFDAVFSGAGDTLSAALAALLASGDDIETATREALGYLDRSLDGGFRPGMGHVLPDRMFWAQLDSDDADDQAETAQAATAESFGMPPSDTKH